MANIINGTQTGNGGLVTTGDDSGILQLQTNETTAVTIDASQNVGVGTASPAARLDINSGSAALTADFNSTSADGLYLRFRNSGTTIGDIGSGKSVFNGTAGDFAVGSRSGSLVFGTSSTERARINSNGSMAIGNTLDTAGLTVSNVGSNGWVINTIVPVSTSYAHMVFNNTNGSVGSILTNGTTTTYATSSDYRLKENIALMTGALSVVQQLKPVTYTWKVDGSNGQGFIAHELQEIVPDCVVGEKDAVDADGNPQYQGIDTSFLVATLTAAIQELKAELDAAKERITALEGATQ